MFIDPLYLLFALPGLALSLWAQFRVKSTFRKYSNVRAARGLSGAEAAATLIRERGLQGVRIEERTDFCPTTTTHFTGCSGYRRTCITGALSRRSGWPRTRPGTQFSTPEATRR